MATSAVTYSRRGRILRRESKRAVLYLLLALVVIAMLGPFVYAISTSFKNSYAMMSFPPQVIPSPPTLDNYTFALTQTPFYRWVFNTFIMATGVTIGNLLFDSMAAFAFARKDFVGKRFLFALMMATLMIPGALLLVPTFLIANDLHLVNTYGGLILPLIGGALGVFLLRQFMESIPTELEYAARIDGCSDFDVFWRIILPLSTPALATLGILTFTGAWNGLIWPLVITNSQNMDTLPVGVATLGSYYQTNYGINSAAALLSAIPLTIVFLFFQRYFIEGLTVGALKS
jgi:multiple sugar transport system permease protein